MIVDVTVKDVIEKNDCAGKKLIYATSEAQDEIYPSYFRLTRNYMFAHDKLALASVSPMDHVKVIVNSYTHDVERDVMIAGEYFDNLENLSNRTPICRCGVLMVSDGFDVYCPNVDCALTLAARLERLSNTAFFSTAHQSLSDHQFLDMFGPSFSNCAPMQKPFCNIVQGLFWGYPGGSLEKALLNRNQQISLATFLIEPLFREFIESNSFVGNNNIVNLQPFSYEPIFQFYADMNELVNRRDINSDRQNKLMFEFIWALGIESLKENHIQMIVEYDKMLELTTDPLLAVIFTLTHSVELINEFGLHRLEAAMIVDEVRRRRYELCDIFSHYSNLTSDVYQSFDTMR